MKKKTPIWLRTSAKVLNKIGETISQQKKYYDVVIQDFKKISDKIERNPHLNFLSLLGANKLIGEVLDNSIAYFYRNRNSYWFKKFFADEELYELIKEDIEFYYKKYPKIKLTLTNNGTMVYDNYKPNQFNILLLTVHGGTWIPEYVNELMAISKAIVYCEEDIGVDSIYGPLVLKKGGIWINSKQSRFVCDFNRRPENAIYTNNSEARVKDIWKEDLKPYQKQKIMKSYKRFYELLNTLIETHRFNIVFDGHSMVNEPGRPSLSFGVKFVPQFYGPIVAEMRKTLSRETKRQVDINNPFSGGYILEHLSAQFPDIFVFSMEINKGIYMDSKCLHLKKKPMKDLSKAITKIFDF
ncbi:MAG: N-formylglutamate amidohydrolase [Nanoarchaeota archaeon]|nr:N-formylglutamate amidohydrolase [Nanoarchaeota archaeon]